MAANSSVTQNNPIGSSPESAESSSAANDEEFFDVCEPVTAIRPQHSATTDWACFHSRILRAHQGYTDILEFQYENNPKGTLARSAS